MKVRLRLLVLFFGITGVGTSASFAQSGGWTPQTSGTGRTLLAVSFVDVNVGMAVGSSGTILGTTTGGEPAL